MTEKKRTSRRLQQAAKERMRQTGEKYTAALYAVRNADRSTSTALPPESASGRDLLSRTGRGASATGEKRTSGEGPLFGDDAAQLGRDTVD